MASHAAGICRLRAVNNMGCRNCIFSYRDKEKAIKCKYKREDLYKEIKKNHDAASCSNKKNWR